MDPNAYPSNSLNNPTIGGGQPTPVSSIPREKLAPVAQGKISTAKPSLFRRFRDVFVAEDISNVGDWLLQDVLAPTIRDIFVFSIINSVRMLAYGRNAIPKGGFGGLMGGSMLGYGYNSLYGRMGTPMTGYGYTPYGNMTMGSIKANGQPVNGTQPHGQPYSTASGLIQPSLIRLPTRADAEIVRDQLAEIMAAYHQVTVADIFDVSGVSGNGATDGAYGWTDLTGMMVVAYPDGYGFQLPPARPLNIQR